MAKPFNATAIILLIRSRNMRLISNYLYVYNSYTAPDF